MSRVSCLLVVALAVGAGLVAVGCSDSCDAGATQMCTCAGGATGAQMCASDGSKWGACSCSPGADAGGGGTDGGGGPTDGGGGPIDSGGVATDAGDVDAAGGGGTDAGGGGGTDAGGGGTDAGEPPGPTVMCAMASRTATATLVEGSAGAHMTAALVYYSGGALRSIDGVACMVDTDRTGMTGTCFDPYICGACRILIFYSGTNRTMSGNCAAYMGFYSIM